MPQKTPDVRQRALTSFIDWLVDDARRVKGEGVRAFLNVALTGKLAGDGLAASRTSDAIRELEYALSTELTIGDGNGTKLTEDGEALTRLLLQLADFVGACRRQPYLWSIGGSDSALQWLVIPVLARIQNELSEKAKTDKRGLRHRKPALFAVRDVRSHLLAVQLRLHQIHFCVARLTKELQEGSFERCDLGDYHYEVFVDVDSVLAAEIAAKREKNKGLCDEIRQIPVAVTKNHKIKKSDGSETFLEEVLREREFHVAAYCESAIQAASFAQHGYAAVLPSYYPNDEGLETYDLELPAQSLVLAAPSTFIADNITANDAFRMLGPALKTQLAKAQDEKAAVIPTLDDRKLLGLD